MGLGFLWGCFSFFAKTARQEPPQCLFAWHRQKKAGVVGHDVGEATSSSQELMFCNPKSES